MSSNLFSRFVKWLADFCKNTKEGQGTSSKETEANTSYAPVFLPDNTDSKRQRKEKKRPQPGKGGNAPSGKQEQPGIQNNRSGKKPAKANEPRQQKPDTHNRKPQKPKSNISMDSWIVPAGPKAEEGKVLFQDLDLDKRILRALLDDMQFKVCSPIQAQALPHALSGKDLAGRAQTGTGKTAAFLITVLQRFLTTEKESREPWQPMAIILAPTRELAIQIAKDAENISAYCGDFKTVAVYGGMDYDKQMRLLAEGVDLVVATPGRLIDFLGRHAVDLGKVEIAVIDEADRMLDMGFIPDVKRIIFHLPKTENRQTMLFSATLTHDIMELASRWMRPDPTVVEIEPDHVVADGIDETVYAVTTKEKIPALLWIFDHEDCRRVLIFRNRRNDVESLHEALVKCGVQCEMLTGDVDQKKRLKILDDFRDGKIKIIVATDVAGRGIHVDDVTHVINYDLPYEAEDYVHRVGRTARAGHKGRAISFADEDCAFVIPEIEKFIERTLPITQPNDDMLILPDNLKGIVSTRSSGSRGTARENNFGGGSHWHGGAPRRPSGSRIRRGGPRN